MISWGVEGEQDFAECVGDGGVRDAVGLDEVEILNDARHRSEGLQDGVEET